MRLHAPLNRSRLRRAPALSALLALTLLACAEIPPRAPAVEGMPRDDRSAPFSAVWIGHASVLMRFGRTTVLADPNLSDHLLTMSRLTRASLRPDELPPIDAVILSHMHLDHFDAPTLRALGPRPAVVYPPEGAAYADEILQPDQRTLAPWASTEVGGVKITAVPARHQGGRYGIDFLWNHAFCGYILEGAGKRIYFAGDTGWDPDIFAEIGKRFPGIDLAFIPIAPSKEGASSFYQAWGHAGPKGALRILEAVGAKEMVPIHFETFFSTGKHMYDARRAMEAAMKAEAMESRVVLLHIGERVALPFEGKPEVFATN